MRKQFGSFIVGAVSTAAIPASYGIKDWRVLAASAAIGGIGALFGVNVPKMAKAAKGKLAARKTTEV